MAVKTADTTTPDIRTHEQLYRAKVGVPEVVEVPPASFLMIDGQGDPNTAAAYAQAIRALYGAAYAVKFALKKSGGPEEHVSPLEGLWWGAEAAGFTAVTKGDWSWTMMIRLPGTAPGELVTGALAATARKKPDLPIGELRVERFAEGRAAQVMYVGSYADEHPAIANLHAFIAALGSRPSGRHHEIYFSDPRRTAPARLKTLLRQPII